MWESAKRVRDVRDGCSCQRGRQREGGKEWVWELVRGARGMSVGINNERRGRRGTGAGVGKEGEGREGQVWASMRKARRGEGQVWESARKVRRGAGVGIDE